MKELIEGIIVDIENNLQDIFKSIVVLVDETVLPDATGYPILGIKDGDVEGTYTHSSSDEFLDVTLVVYILVQTADGAAVMGDQTQAGVLDLIKKVKDYYLENRNSPKGYCLVDIMSETASKFMAMYEPNKEEDAVMYQSKSITMRWEK